MIVKEITVKTMEVMNRAERVKTFIGCNCVIMEAVVITSDDARAILEIIREEPRELYMEADENMSIAYNAALKEMESAAIEYITDISGKVISKQKAIKALSKLIKIFVAKTAKIFNMTSEDYIIYMLMKQE